MRARAIAAVGGVMIAAIIAFASPLRRHAATRDTGAADCPWPEWHDGAIRPYDTCVPAILGDTAFRWHEQQSEHISLHYIDGTVAEHNVDRYLAHAETALTYDLALLGMTTYAPRIHFFLVASRAQLERVTGGSGVGWTVPQSQTIVFVSDSAVGDPEDRHEIMHVLSMNAWGLNNYADMWIREGLAVYATEIAAPGAIDSIARAMFADGRARPLAVYRTNFFEPGVDHFPAYMLSSSFVKFLAQTYGMAKLERVWREGGGAMDTIYSKSALALEAAWKRKLRDTN